MLRSLAWYLAALFLLSSLLCASALAEEPAASPTRSMLMHVSGGIGPYFVFAKVRSEPNFAEDSAETQRDRSSALGGHVALSLGWRVHRTLRLSGQFRFVSIASDDNPDQRVSPASLLLLGPALSFFPLQNHGPLLEARVTGGLVVSGLLEDDVFPPIAAFSPGLELSYIFLVGRLLQLGVGIDLSVMYASSTGEGDYADYHNSDWVLSPSLVFKIGL
ncbi:MAG TPA: hypothetical protein VFZ61_09675 [Polyangiales bacterium]